MYEAVDSSIRKDLDLLISCKLIRALTTMALFTIRLLMVVVAVALALTIWLPTADAFLLPPPPASALISRSDTQLAVALRKLPLVGRFRRKKKVEQVPTIQVGNNLPGYRSAENESGDDATAFPDVIVSGTGGEPTQMHQLLSSDKAILVGESPLTKNLRFLFNVIHLAYSFSLIVKYLVFF